jgi:polyhydroxyalkanoate synthesis regulator phasin
MDDSEVGAMTGTKANKLALAIAAGTLTTALVGGVAFAAMQSPSAETPQVSSVASLTETLSSKDLPKDRLTAVLDALVAKGTITRDQADKILQAVKDAEPSPKPKLVRPTGPSVGSFLGDLTKATSAFLGMEPKDLFAELRAGKSVADVATAKGKRPADLAAALTKTAGDKIDAAVAANKLTADQAASLKQKVAAEIRSFVDRKLMKPSVPKPVAPTKPTPTPKS